MPPTSRTELARDVFTAFAAGDRARIESLLAPSLRFHAPPDPDLDRAGYFERCWPGSGSDGTFDFARIIAAGDQVVEIEVYFGWDLAERSRRVVHGRHHRASLVPQRDGSARGVVGAAVRA